MITKIQGGRVYDPVHGRDGVVEDIFIADGRIVPPPPPGSPVDVIHDAAGKVVMAGAIDIHSHIGGGKVNLARSLLIEDHRGHETPAGDGRRSGSGLVTPSTFLTGYRYAEMGYTAAFEPAVVGANARHAHLEMADIPIIDKGGYLMMGNEDFLLGLLAGGARQSVINDYVALMLKATQCMAVKVVNAGGINAFRFNQRWLDLDEAGPHYGVTPRQILTALARAVRDLGLAHPLHVHGNNLGVPGNIRTTLATMEALDGLPLHLTHIQFHAYGDEGDRKFSSGAAAIAAEVNRRSHLTIDVGQIMFGQTITASGDTMSQFRNAPLGRPRKTVCMDIECSGGCGLVPFNYRDKSFVNALQWAIGLEIFLLVEDPWRVFLTTDHPNGGPFTSYPHLIRLLMDKSFRNDMLKSINRHAAAASTLASITREYSLSEIAILTRAGPARILGLADRGHLGAGAAADVVVYAEQDDKEKMFAVPELVFKDGQLVVRNGKVVAVTWGRTHAVHVEHDSAIEGELDRFFRDWTNTRLGNFRISADEIAADGRGRLEIHGSQGGRSWN